MGDCIVGVNIEGGDWGVIWFIPSSFILKNLFCICNFKAPYMANIVREVWSIKANSKR